MVGKKALFRFYFDGGRAGDLEGIFVSTQNKVNKLIESGIEVYFGEVLGKHSEVYGSIEKHEILFLTDNEEAVRVVEEYNLENGYNPFHYETLEGEFVSDVIDKLLTNK